MASTRQNKAMHPNPDPLWTRKLKANKNLNQNRRGAPSNGLQVSNGRSKMTMTKNIALLLAWMFLCASSRADDLTWTTSISPKLKRFVQDHPTASKSVSEALASAFSDRTMQLYYFYSDDDSIPKASHTYPSESKVVIIIHENQQPCDEYISLLFEILNSEGEKRFKELISQAQGDTISKDDFVLGVMREEFRAVLKTKNILDYLELDPKEKAESHLFGRFTECPTTFEGYLVYKIKAAPKGRDQKKEYEAMFDSLRRDQRSKQGAAPKP